MVEVAEGQPDEHPHEGEDGGEDVVEDRLLDCHPRLEQHCKVPWIGSDGSDGGNAEHDKRYQ